MKPKLNSAKAENVYTNYKDDSESPAPDLPSRVKE